MDKVQKTTVSHWKNYIVKLLPKMSSACYTIRSMYHFSSLTMVKMIYFAYFHSIMEYGIIFWGYSTESKTTF
jgi:hypothetical protein